MNFIVDDNRPLFERKRVELLASILCRRFGETEAILAELCENAKKNPLSEGDQKSLRQVFQSVKRFKGNIPKPFSSPINLLGQRLRKILSETARAQIKNPQQVTFSDFRRISGLSDAMYRVMLSNVTSLQISTGCTNCCRRCNEWALPGVRKHFDFHAVKRLITDLFEAGNSEFSCYSASDPLDWRDGKKNIIDIASFLREKNYRPEYGLLTKIPAGSEPLLKKLAETDVDFSVSITDKNRDLVQRLQKSSGKRFDVQHDTDDLLIPAGLDEDFSTVKSSITDVYGVEITPEGAFVIVPTFTSALYPTGQCRIRIDERTPFFLKKITGRRALSQDYFAPLEAVGPSSSFFLTKLLKPQVENIMLCNGHEEVSPPGMMNMRAYFKSLEKEAMLQRKKIFPSFVRNARKRHFSSSKEKERLRQEVTDYHQTTTESGMIQIRRRVFSDFLKSISDYVISFPAETEVIKHLRRHDRETYRDHREIPVQERIDENDSNLFPLFQTLLFRLLDNPSDREIQTFIG